MTPLEPRDDHGADRDDRGARHDEHDADSLAPRAIDCHESLEHLIGCVDCRQLLVALVYKDTTDWRLKRYRQETFNKGLRRLVP